MRTRSHVHRAASLAVALVFAPHGTALGETPEPAPPAPAPPVPAAEPSIGDSLTGAAKEHYQSARILFDNGDYAGALVKFRHAQELSGDERLFWNMGACEKHLRHYVRVLRMMERYLQSSDPRITEAQRDNAALVLRTVRALVSPLGLTVNEPGASVFVDGEAAGTTPLREPILVDLGDRQIRVSKPGFKDHVVVQHITGASGVELNVVLVREARPGRLAIETRVSDASIYVDGRFLGVARWAGPLLPGDHSVRVTAPGRQTYKAQVTLRDGESRSLDITLNEEGGNSSLLWWIGGGVVAAAGLGTAAYFLARPEPEQETAAPTKGTISPFFVPIE